MKILTVPNATLRQKSQPVKTVDRRLQKLLRELEQTLARQKVGVGLAAPQLGITKRVLAVVLPGKKPRYQYFLNPVILSQAETLTLGEGKNKELEGCLSVPKIYAPVYRPTWLEVAYEVLDSKGQLQARQEKFVGFAARVVIHELDHLDGILFIDHVWQQNTPIYLENAQGELDEIDAAKLKKRLGTF